MATLDPETRFWSHVDKNGPIPEARPELGPCWLWTGSPSSIYGEFWNGLDGKRYEQAHRYAYGDVPLGCLVDHLCCVKKCVRRSHLEAVSAAENTRRAMRTAASQARHDARMLAVT